MGLCHFGAGAVMGHRDGSDRETDRGVALLMVLALVTTISIISAGLLQATSQALRVTSLSLGRLQIDWYVRGAEALAADQIETVMTATRGRVTRATPGLGQPLEFPIEGGVMRATLEDATNCFNLNSLAGEPSEAVGGRSYDARAQFQSVLGGAGLDNGLSLMLTEAITDWIDADTLPRPSGAEDSYYNRGELPYLTANGLMGDLSELLAIRGIDRETYRALAPLFCVRPDTEPAVLNINTITPDQAPLMVPLFSDIVPVAELRRVLSERPQSGFASVEAFFQTDPLALVAEEARFSAMMGDMTTHFDLSGEVVYADAYAAYGALFEVGTSGEARLLRRRSGVDEQ